MNKILNPGAAPAYPKHAQVFLLVEFSKGELSITGVHGPKPGGNAVGSCGQIVETLREVDQFAPGWSAELVAQLADVWDRWHLNHMRAGSPAQAAELAKHTFPGYPVSHYEWARDLLRAAGLSPDESYLYNGKPYAYGNAWLREEVPVDVLAFLESLPETTVKPAWV